MYYDPNDLERDWLKKLDDIAGVNRDFDKEAQEWYNELVAEWQHIEANEPETMYKFYGLDRIGDMAYELCLGSLREHVNNWEGVKVSLKTDAAEEYSFDVTPYYYIEASLKRPGTHIYLYIYYHKDIGMIASDYPLKAWNEFEPLLADWLTRKLLAGFRSEADTKDHAKHLKAD